MPHVDCMLRTTAPSVGSATLALVQGIASALRHGWLERRERRAAARRERLYALDNSGRERYFAAAHDVVDLERRQRSWERTEHHSWR